MLQGFSLREFVFCGWDRKSLAMEGQIGRSLVETGVVAWQEESGNIRLTLVGGAWNWPSSVMICMYLERIHTFPEEEDSDRKGRCHDVYRRPECDANKLFQDRGCPKLTVESLLKWMIWETLFRGAIIVGLNSTESTGWRSWGQNLNKKCCREF